MDILKVIHVVNAILMAWPFYALVTVNQRGSLGPPLGDRADTYMENIIKNRALPCFVLQGTALASGLLLVFLRGMGLNALVANPILGLKSLLLLIIAALLTYVHTTLQPQIDALFARAGGQLVPQELGQQITKLRLRRKRMASVCLFVVLTAAMLGVQTWAPFPYWLTIVLVIGIAALARRAYSGVRRWM
ncbi:MAG: hypothetical protein HYX77_01190 [Acidobacteria bacterium]|nr:hypothetical protein [Acidobacteriota bacterium]